MLKKMYDYINVELGLNSGFNILIVSLLNTGFKHHTAIFPSEHRTATPS